MKTHTPHMKGYLALIVLLMMLASALPLMPAGAVLVSGDITKNTTWTVGGSPYIINSKVRIIAGVTLKINQGVTARFEPGGVMIVEGVLDARGTVAKPIWLMGNTSTSRGTGIVFPDVYRGGSMISYCNISHLENGIEQNGPTNVTVLNSTFTDDSHGILCRSGNISVKDCRFDSNDNDIDHYGELLSVTDCQFDNSTNGIYGYGSWEWDSDINMDGCVFDHVNSPYVSYARSRVANCTMKYGSTAMEQYWALPSTFENISIEAFTSWGITDYSVGSQFSDILINNTFDGIYCSAWDTSVTDCFFVNTIHRCVEIDWANDVLFDNCTLSLSFGGNASVLQNGGASLFRNCTMSTLLAPSSVMTDHRARVTLINTSWNPVKRVLQDPSDRIYEYSFMDVKVTNLSAQSVPGALVFSNSTTLDMDVGSGVTDMSGYLRDTTFLNKIYTRGGTMSGNPTNTTAVKDHGSSVDRGYTVSSPLPSTLVNVMIGPDTSCIVWSGDHYVNTVSESYNNVTIYALGDVVVNQSFILTLHNVSLYMVSPDGIVHELVVHGGASLLCRDSEIRSRGVSGWGDPALFELRAQGTSSAPAVLHLNQTSLEGIDQTNLDHASVSHDGGMLRNCMYLGAVDSRLRYNYTTMADVGSWSIYHGDLYLFHSIIHGSSSFNMDSSSFRMISTIKVGGNSFLDVSNTTTHVEQSNISGCYSAIQLSGPPGSAVYINNTNISSMQYGIELYGNDNEVHLSHDTFYSLASDAIYVSSNGNIIDDAFSRIDHCNMAVEVFSNTDIYMSGSRILSCDHGLYIGAPVYLYLDSITSHTTYQGIYVFSGGGSIYATGSIFSSTGTSPNATLYFVNLKMATFVNCSISQGTAFTGIYLERSDIALLNTSVTGFNAISMNDNECRVSISAFFDVRLVNGSGGSVDNGYYEGQDQEDNFLSSGRPDPSGYVRWQRFNRWTYNRTSNRTMNQTLLHGLCGSGANTHFAEEVVGLSPGQLVILTLQLNSSVILWPGDHVLTSNESYHDVIIIAYGNVTIPSPYWLAFDTNVSLMLLPMKENKGINVLDGGFLNSTGSHIGAIGESAPGKPNVFFFRVGKSTGGRLNLTGTDVWGVDRDGIVLDHSVEVYLENITLDGGDTGFRLRDSLVFINDSTIMGFDRAVSMERAAMVMTWSDISYCNVGVDIHDSSFAAIGATTFHDCFDHNIVIQENSVLNLSYNQFTGYSNGLSITGSTVNSYLNNYSVSWNAVEIDWLGVFNSVEDVFWSNNNGIESWYWGDTEQPVVHLENSTFAGSTGSAMNLYYTVLEMYNTTLWGCNNGIYASSGTTDTYNLNTYGVGGDTLKVEYARYFNMTDSNLSGSSGVSALSLLDSTARLYNSSIYMCAAPWEIDLYGKSTAYLVNCSYNNASVRFEDGRSRVNVLWWTHIFTRYSTGTGVSANVTVRLATLVMEWSGSTDATGWAFFVPVLSEFRTNTGVDRSMNPHNFSATIPGPFHAYTRRGIYDNSLIILTFYDTVDPVTGISIGTPRYRAAAMDLWNVSSNTTFTLTATDVFTGVSNTYVRIDTGSWAIYLSPFMLGNGVLSGRHTIEYYSTDNSGNSEAHHFLDINLDRLAPVVQWNFEGPQYKLGTFDPFNVTSTTYLNVTATDAGCTVAYTELSVDTGAYKQYTAPVCLGSLGIADGMHLIRIKAGDQLGNEQNRNVWFYYDTTPPDTYIDVGVPSYRASPGDVWNITWDTPLTPVCQDNRSGVGMVFIQVDTGPWQLLLVNSFNLSGLAQGIHTIRFNATDHLGNMEPTRQLQVFVDVQGPSVLLDIGSPSYRKEIADNWSVTDKTPITLNATDSGSGAMQILYRVDGGEWFTFDGSFTLVGNDGPHTIECYGVDWLGNVGQLHSRILVRDTVGPIVDLSVGFPAYRAHPGDILNITTTTPLDVIGAPVVEYRIDSGAFHPLNGTLTLTGMGIHQLYIVGYDELGNKGPVVLVRLRVDTEAPAVDLLTSTPSYRANSTDRLNITRSTTVSLVATDVSGVSSIRYRLDGGTEREYTGPFDLSGLLAGKHTVEYHATDGLGMASRPCSTGLYLVMGPPQVWLVANEPHFDTPDTLYVSTSTELGLGSDSPCGMSVLTYKIDHEIPVTYTGLFSLTGFSEGSHTLYISGTDNLGQSIDTVSLPLYLDDAPPKADAVLSGAGGPREFTGGVSIEITALDAGSGLDRLEYSLDSDGFMGYDGPILVTDVGDHTLEYRATDHLGNTMVPVTETFTLTGGSGGGGYYNIGIIPVPASEMNVSTFTVKGICTPGFVVEVYLDGLPASDMFVAGGSFRITLELSEGNNTLSCSLLDGGIAIANSSIYNILVDTRAPGLVSVNPEDGAVVSGNTGELTLTFDEPVVSHSVEGLGGDGNISGSILTIPLPTLPGSYIVRVHVEDRLGNGANYTVSFTVSADDGGGPGSGGSTVNTAMIVVIALLAVLLLLFAGGLLLMMRPGKEVEGMPEEEALDGEALDDGMEVIEAEIEDDPEIDFHRKKRERSRAASGKGRKHPREEVGESEEPEEPEEPELPEGLEELEELEELEAPGRLEGRVEDIEVEVLLPEIDPEEM